MADKNCIFCKILAGELPANKIYEDEDTLAVLDINPLSKGHSLLLLKQHQPELFELGNDLYSHYLSVAQKLGRDLKRKLGAERVNIKTDGAHVPEHVHIHLIPVYQKPPSAAPTDPEQLAELLRQT